MLSILKKEMLQFFSSLTGYIAIIIFLLINSLFLFVLQESSIFEFGYANLDKFFELAPWVLLFLIPAISMRSFSEEFKTGTFELLKTKPLTPMQIIFGKYLSILLITVFVILPTLIYVVTIKFFSLSGTIDSGGILGSYIGLLLLSAVYGAVSIYCSSLTSNAVVAFLISGFVCLILFFGFNAISKLNVFQGNADYYIEMIGIDFHYKSISRGVLDTRDLVYFFSLISLFLFVTKKNLHHK